MNTRFISCVAGTIIWTLSPVAIAADPVLSVAVTGEGSVTSAPAGIDCPADCEESYARRAKVILTAEPVFGQTLVGWGGSCTGIELVCEVNMNKNRAVTAEFTTGQAGPVAPLPQTGQTVSFATGDDGDLQIGVPLPKPRFTDNGDGTVTDLLTNLMWLQDVACIGTRAWNDGFTQIGLLNGPEPPFECFGYTATYDDWRMPNINELNSLTDYAWVLTFSNAAGTGQATEGDPFWNLDDIRACSALPCPTGFWSSTVPGASGPDLPSAPANAGSPVPWKLLGYVTQNEQPNPTSAEWWIWPVRGGN